MSQAVPSLGAALLVPIWDRIVEKPFLGSPHVKYPRCFNAGAYLFEQGALIGRARREQVVTMAKMFSQPGGENETIKGLQEMAGEWLETYGKESDSLLMLFFRKELASYQLSFSSDLRDLKKLFDGKLRAEHAHTALQLDALMGIAFGSRFPEITETLYRQEREGSLAKWDELLRKGLDLPKPCPFHSTNRKRSVLAL